MIYRSGMLGHSQSGVLMLRKYVSLKGEILGETPAKTERFVPPCGPFGEI